MRSRRVFALLLGAALFFAPYTHAQPADHETARDFIHADLPLFGGGTEQIWPRSIMDADSIGCASRVAFGDWALHESEDEQGRNSEWFGIRNYGVFHCMAIINRGYQREDLVGGESHPSFFVLMGMTRVANSEVELWALQIGARPGSDYLLLSREAVDGLIGNFNVLQTDCPRASVRTRGVLAVVRTDYCAINTRSDLLRLARRMAQRPPRGTLTLVERVAEHAGDE